MPHIKLAALAFAVVAGILLSEYLSGALLPFFLLVIIVLFIIRGIPKATAAILILLFLISYSRYQVMRLVKEDDISLFRDIRSAQGVVISDPEYKNSKTRFLVNLTEASADSSPFPVSGKVMVSVYDEIDSVPEYGDRIRFSGRFYTPQEPTNPGQLDWKRYLGRQGIYTCASVGSRSDILIIDHGKWSMLRLAIQTRKRFVKQMSSLFPQKEASLIAGMVLGTHSYLDRKTFNSFADSGTIHILAASGYNCYLILIVFTKLLNTIRIERKKQACIIIPAIWFYVAIVGAKPSLFRAAIVASLWILAFPLKRVPNLKNLFFASILIILMIRPSDLFDIGFQLSFASVAALIWAEPVWRRFIDSNRAASTFPKKRNVLLRKLIQDFRLMLLMAITGTAAVSILTFPITVYYFNRVSLVSVPANIAMAFLVPNVFASGIASLILGWIPYIGAMVNLISIVFARLVLLTAHYTTAYQYSVITIATPSLWLLGGYYLLAYSGIRYVDGFVKKNKA